MLPKKSCDRYTGKRIIAQMYTPIPTINSYKFIYLSGVLRPQLTEPQNPILNNRINLTLSRTCGSVCDGVAAATHFTERFIAAARGKPDGSPLLLVVATREGGGGSLAPPPGSVLLEEEIEEVTVLPVCPLGLAGC